MKAKKAIFAFPKVRQAFASSPFKLSSSTYNNACCEVICAPAFVMLTAMTLPFCFRFYSATIRI